MSSGRVFVERCLTPAAAAAATTTTTTTTATHASRRSPHDHNNIISSKIPGGGTGVHDTRDNMTTGAFSLPYFGVARRKKRTV